MSLLKRYRLFPTSDVIESTNLAAVSPATVAATATNNMHFLQSGGAAHLAGANNSDHPPDPKSWRGTKGEAMPTQSLTACKPCFRHATAHAEIKAFVIRFQNLHPGTRPTQYR